MTATRSGSTLEILAADAPGAWGLRPAFLIVDEICQWADTPSAAKLWEAVTSAAAKTPGCRLAVLTTAGDPAHWSRKMLDHALADPLLARARGAGASARGSTPSGWRSSAAGSRTRPSGVCSRTSGSPPKIGLRAPTISARASLLDGPVAPQPQTRYVIGARPRPEADSTVAAVCHADLVTRYQTASGLRGGHPDRARQDGGLGGNAAQPSRCTTSRSGSREASIDVQPRARPVRPLAGARVGAAASRPRRRLRASSCSRRRRSGSSASTLHLLIRNHLLALPDDEKLIDELAAVRLRETSPGVVRMDHAHGQHDDRAIALALAATALLERPSGPGTRRLLRAEHDPGCGWLQRRALLRLGRVSGKL